jgi:hypothetical protein
MERKYSENLRGVEKLKTNERSTEKTREELRAKVAQLQDELETRYDRYMMTFWSNVGCLNQETLFARHVTQR